MRGIQAVALIAWAALSAGTLRAGESWNQKPYTQWTLAELRQILENSAWVRSEEVFVRNVRVDQVHPSSNDDGATRVHTVKSKVLNHVSDYPEDAGLDVGARARSTFYFEWLSALTVRQALARQLQFRGPGGQAAARQLLDWQPGEYVVGVSGAAIALFQQATQESLRQLATLEVRPSGQALSPVKVEFVRAGLLLAEVRFYFPRVANGRPAIGPKDKKIRFTCRLPGESLGTVFDLRKMTRDGRPDL